MISLPRFFPLFATAVSVLATVGCAKNASQHPKVVRASGRVVYNGQPLEGAHVTFTNSAANVSAYARTDADGKFTLTTFNHNDGAVPGPQRISVSKVQVISHTNPDVDRTTIPARGKSPGPERRWLIPQRYANVETSGLTTEIPDSGKNDLIVELQGSP